MATQALRVLYRYEVYRNGAFIGPIHAHDLPHAYLVANARYGAGIEVRF